LTQEHLARFFVLVYLAIHALAGLRALTMTLRQLYILGARKRLSAREIQRFEEAFATLSRAGVLVPGGRFLRRPLIWRVRDDTQGMQMRFVGPALVVDRGLLFSPHFCPLLAHELARVNSFDWLTRAFYSLLPPLRWAALTLFGLPLGAGKLLFYPFWLVYWRWRIYTADEYAAHLGQQHALKRTLDELRWLLDGGRATPGGRWLRETPYIESRIDRLERYQSRPFEDC
jgi:hypothetical protein